MGMEILHYSFNKNIDSYHKGLGKWVQMGNSGVLPAMIIPMGIPEDVTVIVQRWVVEARVSWGANTVCKREGRGRIGRGDELRMDMLGEV